MRNLIKFQNSQTQKIILLISFLFIFLLMSLTCSAQIINPFQSDQKEERKIFLVKKEDLLSNILVENYIGPLYGKDGYIKKTIALNKSKINSNGEFNDKTCIRGQCTIELPFIKEPYFQKNQKPIDVKDINVANTNPIAPSISLAETGDIGTVATEDKKIEQTAPVVELPKTVEPVAETPTVGLDSIVQKASTSYKVLKGDVLSTILLYKKLRPIYGINGYIKRTYELNKTKILASGIFNTNTCVGGACTIELPIKSKLSVKKEVEQIAPVAELPAESNLPDKAIEEPAQENSLAVVETPEPVAVEETEVSNTSEKETSESPTSGPDNYVEKTSTTYKVKKGDVLSMILFNKKLRPIYGPNGFIKRTHELNKTKVLANGIFDINTCVGGDCTIELPVKSNLPAEKTSIAEVSSDRASSAIEDEKENQKKEIEVAQIAPVAEVQPEQVLPEKTIEGPVQEKSMAVVVLPEPVDLVLDKETTTYKVKKGDVLSMILFNKKLRPIYGPTGFIKRTHELNKTKIFANGIFDINTCVGGDCTIELPVKSNLPEEKISTTEVSSDRAPSAIQDKDEDEDENEDEKKEEQLTSVSDSQPEQVVSDTETETDYKEIENKNKISAETLPESLPNIVKPQSVKYQFPKSSFSLSPAMSFLKVSSSDDVKLGGVNAVLLSKKGINANLKLNLMYDEHLTIYGYSTLDYHVFYADPVYTFYHTEQSRVHFGLGTIFQTSAGNEFTAELSMRQKTFLNVLTATTMTIDSIGTPEISFGYGKYFMRKRTFSGKINFQVLGILPSTQGSYKSDAGLGFATNLKFTESDKSLFLSYKVLNLKINNNVNQETSLLLGVTLGKE